VRGAEPDDPPVADPRINSGTIRPVTTPEAASIPGTGIRWSSSRRAYRTPIAMTTAPTTNPVSAWTSSATVVTVRPVTNARLPARPNSPPIAA